MKLGFLITPDAPANSLYRVVFPMRALERRGHTVVWPPRFKQDAPLKALMSCDLVHCFRRDDRNADLKELARRGIAVSVDNDDDLGELDVMPGVSRHQSRMAYTKKASRLAAQAREADLVTTPSAAIAAKYEQSGATNVVVIENYLDPDMAGLGGDHKHDGVVVGWVAAREHAPDVSALAIGKTMTRLLREHENLSVVTVGLKLDLRPERYRHIPPVRHEELLEAISRIDIGIAPLADNAFNRARSNVKLKEYGAVGAAWLASPVAPYLGLGEKQGGLLVKDDEWFDAIGNLIRSPMRRRRLARRALRWARSQTIDRQAARWESEFERAIELARARRSVSSSPCPPRRSGTTTSP